MTLYSMKYLFTLLLSFVWVLFGIAQTVTDLHVKFVNTADGLSSSAVLSICQDESGLLWFGTYDGLNCYDGKNVEVYNNISTESQLRSNIIHKICQADNHCLWLKTYHDINRFSLVSRSVEKTFNHTMSWKILSNISGNTWAINGDSLMYYNTRLEKFLCVDTCSFREYYEAFVDKEGHLMLLPENSDIVVDYSINSFDNAEPSELRFNKTSLKFHHKKVLDYYIQHESFSFIDEDYNLYLYDPTRKSKIFISNIAYLVRKYGSITNVLSLHDDIIVAFSRNGLVRLVSENHYREKIIDGRLCAFSAFKDVNNDIVWIGTDGQGAMAIMKNNSIAHSIMLKDLSPMLKRQIRCISTDHYGGLWFGTKGDGVVYIPEYERANLTKKVFHMMDGTVSPLDNLRMEWKDNKIFFIEEDIHNKGMWFGGGHNSVYFYSFERKKIYPLRGLPDFITQAKNPYTFLSLKQQNKSVLWISVGSVGLVRLSIDFEQGEPVVKDARVCEIKDSKGVVLTVFAAMTKESDSILWVGDVCRGLVRFNMDTEQYEPISLEQYLHKSVNDIMSVLPYDKDKYYICTTSGLVSMNYSEGTVHGINFLGDDNPQLAGMIHGVLADRDGFLWLSSNNGLYKYNPNNGSVHTFFGNGIKIKEFSDGAYYKCPYSGYLFFGGNNGLLYLYRNTNVLKKFYPDVVLRKFCVDNHFPGKFNYRRGNLEGWRFDSDYSFFSFDYIAPDYMNSKNIEYSYMLEGYDKEWSTFSTSTQAVYMKVPPGKYIFKVKYKRDISENNTKTLEIPIYINQPFCQSLSAKIMFFLLLMLLGMYFEYLYLKYRATLSHVDGRRITSDDEHPLEHVSSYGISFTVRDNEQKKFLGKLLSLIETHISDNKFDIPFISAEMCLSTRQFYRKFGELDCSVSPGELVKLCRLEKAAEQLRTTDAPIQSIYLSVGINSRSYFYKEFIRKYGVTPRDYRLQHSAEESSADS